MTAMLTAPTVGRDDTPYEADTFTAAADLEILFAAAVLTAADRRGDMARIFGGPRLAVAVPVAAMAAGWVATATVDRGGVSILAEQRGGTGIATVEIDFLTGDQLAEMDTRYWDEVVGETVATIPAIAAALIAEAAL
ncbi:Uncharacterised protein [Mycobacteroides abscessus subsp. abscessus]|uniref:hypothetical protein n=1 Tax=Mycobacteroides abscessus TaxID=36809 RepID=UPI0009A55E7B|nr:hypothetical protein [Mycobacteroides abscessus]SLJ23669.1 Uncharacterised protein [Mycobacteroides abscessus subsp. abscessus]